MTKTTDFTKALEKHNKSLYDNHTYHAETRHIHFDEKAVEFPKGITVDSLNKHNEFVHNLTIAVEDTTAKIARDEYEKDNKIQFVDGSLQIGNLNIQSHHTIWDDVEGNKEHGNSYTAAKHHLGHDEAIVTMKEKNKELAKSLFEKHNDKKD